MLSGVLGLGPMHLIDKCFKLFKLKSRAEIVALIGTAPVLFQEVPLPLCFNSFSDDGQI
jgi:hypothetical protein